MSDIESNDMSEATQAFLRQLEASGFFQQISELENNLREISGNLKDLGEKATRRLDETESLAAHVLAVEAVLTVMLRDNPIAAEAVKAVIKENTSDLSDGGEGSPAVQTIAADILARARGE